MKPTTKITKAIHLVNEIYLQTNVSDYPNPIKAQLADDRLAKAYKYLSLVKKQLKVKK